MKMNWLLGCSAVLVVAAVGCSVNVGNTGGAGGTGSGTTVSTTSKTSVTSTKAATATVTVGQGTGTGTGGAGDISCNPVKDTQCNLAAGQACDGGMTGFVCYDAPNDGLLCGACDNKNTYCSDGHACYPSNAAGDGKCMRYCCTDADCGGGVGSCDKNLTNDPAIGLCGAAMGGGGAGGGAGFATPVCTGIPPTAPSNGSCYTP